MRDPHVESLRYKLKESGQVTYEDPLPVQQGFGRFDVELADGVLTCTLNEHFAAAEEARGVVEPVIRAWEIDAAMKWGRGEFNFAYEGAKVIERDPVPGAVTLQVDSAHHVLFGDTVTLHVTRNRYPNPPVDFAVSPDVETLWNRYQGYLNGKEPLLSMGYFCLTVLQAMAGGRKAAASRFNIEMALLNRLGELTSERGDGQTARKLPTTRVLAPLASEEERWIVELVPRLIRRAGEHAANHLGPRLTMKDLPPL